MFTYENHIPSRAEIVIGMAADAIRRWCDRRELAKFVHGDPGEAGRVARDLNLDTETLVKIAGRGNGPPVLLNRRLALLGIDPEQLRQREPAAAQDLAPAVLFAAARRAAPATSSATPQATSGKTTAPTNTHLRR